ncbi:MAG: Copper chaperone [Firmicutes bacterium]|nr:Copper chaperone [Bacillota bacterium]MDI6706011.1 copper ion binding protein [Bacillota bacterium]
MSKSVLHVSGMSCNHCVMAIKKAVGSISGVTNVEVSLEKGTVTVDYQEGLNPEEVKRAIEDTGYDVV